MQYARRDATHVGRDIHAFGVGGTAGGLLKRLPDCSPLAKCMHHESI